MTAKDWYSPGEIRFDVDTARWLIQNLSQLESGHWPPEASNYIDIPGTKSRGHRAPFATPVEYSAEVKSRMEKCVVDGVLDGLILEAIESWGKSPESLAIYFGMTEWSIIKRAEKALRYVASGSARRWHKTSKRAAKTYPEFKRKRS